MSLPFDEKLFLGFNKLIILFRMLSFMFVLFYLIPGKVINNVYKHYSLIAYLQYNLFTNSASMRSSTSQEYLARNFPKLTQ